jgi:hypothetical protein
MFDAALASVGDWAARFPAFAACLLFVLAFALFYRWRPEFAFRSDGTQRPFGVRRPGATPLPVPAVAALLAAASYYAVLQLAAATR